MADIKYLLRVFMGPLFSLAGYFLHSNALVIGGLVLLILTASLNRLVDRD